MRTAREPLVGDSRWFRAMGSSPRKSLRLICFAHAGGSGAMYFQWLSELASTIELVGVELPGRGRRASETPLARMDLIVAALKEELQRDASVPCVFFGHSFGGALAFALASAILCEWRDYPLRGLILSGCLPPHLRSPRSRKLASLPREEFFDELSKLNGLPDEVMRNTKLQKWIEPALRADIVARDTWVAAPQKSSSPLPIPIHVLGGTGDSSVPESGLAAWERYTSRAHTLQMFSGGHFYFSENPAPVRQAIRQAAESAGGYEVSVP